MALRAGGLLLLLSLSIVFRAENCSAAVFGRQSFPEGFLFGASSAAYQYEGAAREGGKGPSIWDTFTHQHPDKIADRSNGDVAVDSYHRYKEDVSIIQEMGLHAYRFSVSWPRILPNGSLSGGINKEGVNYYNNLINELLSKGIQPFITIFHWDSPQALEDKYQGFLSQNIVKDYVDYSEVCFKEFGDRVKHWITFNEPWSFCYGGYATGYSAPGRCSSWQGCSVGDAGREPYTACHHMLIAHAEAVKLYRQKYQAYQKGIIGITLNTQWFVPYSRSNSDIRAAQRALDFMYGWIMDPLNGGDYPRSMRLLVGNRLPKFTKEELKLVNGSFDFIGLNYYTSTYATSLPPSNGLNLSYDTDDRVNLTAVRNGIPIGPKAPSLYIYPLGMREILLYTKKKYNNPVIYITENGVDEVNNGSLSLEEALKDNTRIEYYHKHLLKVKQAISEGVDVRGFFAWSLLDNFEWATGYTVRFGINFVDYKNNLKRYPKKSAHWFKKFLKK